VSEGGGTGTDRRHATGKLSSSVSSSSAAANTTSSPAGSPVTKRSAARILPSILGRFTSHRSASSDRLKRCSSHRRTESSENITMSLSSSPGSPASVGAPSSPSRPWESRLMVWDSRSALSLNQDESSTLSQSTDVSPAADAGPAPPGNDDIVTSPAGHASDVSSGWRLLPWRTDVSQQSHHHQQQQSEWTLELGSSEQNSRRSSMLSTTTVNGDTQNA